jgi:hypothetical protein
MYACMYVCNYVYVVLTHICTTKVIFCNWNTEEDKIIIIIIPGHRNMIKKEDEKILKYNDLTIEIQGMWNVKTRVIPVINGTTGTISKSFRKCLSDIPGNHDVKELQKTAILGTAHILRKVLT